MSILVLLRHGQSQWNLENRFTGWEDIELSDKGILYFILEKKIKIIKKQLEKDVFKENYYIKCLNSENNYLPK